MKKLLRRDESCRYLVRPAKELLPRLLDSINKTASSNVRAEYKLETIGQYWTS